MLIRRWRKLESGILVATSYCQQATLANDFHLGSEFKRDTDKNNERLSWGRGLVILWWWCQPVVVHHDLNPIANCRWFKLWNLSGPFGSLPVIVLFYKRNLNSSAHGKLACAEHTPRKWLSMQRHGWAFVLISSGMVLIVRSECTLQNEREISTWWYAIAIVRSWTTSSTSASLLSHVLLEWIDQRRQQHKLRTLPVCSGSTCLLALIPLTVSWILTPARTTRSTGHWTGSSALQSKISTTHHIAQHGATSPRSTSYCSSSSSSIPPLARISRSQGQGV